MNKINTKEQIITSFMSTEISEQHLRGFLKVYFKFNYKLLYNLYNLNQKQLNLLTAFLSVLLWWKKETLT